jgi:hypothetical protein
MICLSDYSFAVMNSICFIFFCVEFVFATWAKSTISSFRPLQYSGYIFNFFWWLDLASVVSMFPDVTWIAQGIGIGSLSDGGVTGKKSLHALRLILLTFVIFGKVIRRSQRLAGWHDWCDWYG